MKLRAFFALLLFLVLPLTAEAAVNYVSVMERSNTLVKIRQATIKTENWFLCDVVSLACTPTASTTPLSIATTTPETPAWRSLLPQGASWRTVSPNGTYVAFYIAATQARGKRTFGVLHTETGALYTKDIAVSYWDLLTEGISIFSFSPDSKTLLYLDDSVNEPILHRVDLTQLPPGGGTLASKKLFSRAYTVADMEWHDNDTLYFIANRTNPYTWSLYRYTLSSGALTEVVKKVSFAHNLQKIEGLFLLSIADEHGVRPLVYNPTLGTTAFFPLPAVDVPRIEGRVVTTLKNNVKGTYFIEPSKKSDTLLVWLHGGPYRQASLYYHPYLSYGGYDWVLEEARKTDVGILKIDYPGSAGFGRLYAESITGKVGVKDAIDVRTAVLDFAKRNGYKNIYLMGNSYGGYLALKLLVDSPASYKGAMTVAGVADWTTLLTALDNSIFNVQFKGTANEANNDLYTKASIYNGLTKLTTQQVFIVHGTKDTTIPYAQSEGLSRYMTSIDNRPNFISLQDEDHVFKKPESFETLCTAVLAMMNKEKGTSCVL